MKTIVFERPDGKKLNIEIIKYDFDPHSRNTSVDRHRHDFHSIFFVLKGNSQQELDFKSYDLAANQIMIIPKGAVHWEKTYEPMAAYVILFKEAFFSDVQLLLLNSFFQYAIASGKLLIDVPSKQIENLKRYFQLLHEEQELEESQNQTFLLQNLMLALLNKIEGLVQNLPNDQSFISTRKPFQRFIELVERHFHQQQSLDFYTSRLQITSRKLNDITKTLTGQTASNFIIDRIITEAKRELCFNEKSIKEIAIDLGYDNQYYFSRIFKKRTNLSPEQFRSQFAE